MAQRFFCDLCDAPVTRTPSAFYIPAPRALVNHGNDEINRGTYVQIEVFQGNVIHPKTSDKRLDVCEECVKKALLEWIGSTGAPQVAEDVAPETNTEVYFSETPIELVNPKAPDWIQDGEYLGYWQSNLIHCLIGKDTCAFETEIGIRGKAPAVLRVKDAVMSAVAGISLDGNSVPPQVAPEPSEPRRQHNIELVDDNAPDGLEDGEYQAVWEDDLVKFVANGFILMLPTKRKLGDGPVQAAVRVSGGKVSVFALLKIGEKFHQWKDSR